jgi:putative glutamine amidotransferase
MQVANVAFGGTLVEDIGSDDPSALEHRVVGAGTETHQHEVKLEPLSDIAMKLGRDSIEANSVHHQALRDVAAVFQVVGRAPDGVIEAIEAVDEDWAMWGVQWHPEYLGERDGPSLDLFKAFVAAASA